MGKKQNSLVKRKKAIRKLFSTHKENSLSDNDNNMNNNFDENKSIISNEDINYDKDDDSKDKKTSKWTDLNVIILSSHVNK